MQIEDFKTWHWMVLGPIVGILFGCIILWRGPSSDVPNINTLDQGRFERAASGTPGLRRDEALIPEFAAGKPWLKDLVVHPPIQGDNSDTYWVLGEVYSVDVGRKDPKDPASPFVTLGDWSPFRYPAKAPYRAVLAAPGVYPSVMDYLTALKQKSPDSTTRYRFAWWDSTAATIALPTMAGFLIIGVAWPMAIHLLQGAGLARPSQPNVKQPKRRPAAATAKAAVDHSTGDRRLDEMNTQLEQDLAAGASSSGGKAAAAAPGDAPVKALAGTPEAAAAAAEKERLIREYGGEFYPVVRSVHKEGEDEEEKPH
jgi:hypothetical protein